MVSLTQFLSQVSYKPRYQGVYIHLVKQNNAIDTLFVINYNIINLIRYF